MSPTSAHATLCAQQASTGSDPGSDQTGLLDRLHAGDQAAFSDLYHAHLPALTAHVAARLSHRDRDMAADLVHDAFGDALADPTRIDVDVLGCLRRLCDQACTRYLWTQRQYLRAAHTIFDDQQRTGQHPPQPAVIDGQGGVEALEALPDGQRQVAYLRFLDGQTRQVTARLLGRSVRTVVYLERRARRRLREQLTNPTVARADATPIPATATGQA
jgi:RNA polymerase sigma factor (sigma-70 family)